MIKNNHKEKHTVMLVEDHSIVRMGLSMLISQLNDMRICKEAGTGDEALNYLKYARADIIIIDISLGDMSGLDLIKYIRRMNCMSPILVLSVFDEKYYAERALAAGALGYIMKQEASEVITHAIRTVLSGKIYVSNKIKNSILERAIGIAHNDEDVCLRTLTDRELQVFELIGKGCETKSIAKQLRLSNKTIDTYRENIKCKLDLKNSTELIQYASRWEMTRNM